MTADLMSSSHHKKWSNMYAPGEYIYIYNSEGLAAPQIFIFLVSSRLNVARNWSCLNLPSTRLLKGMFGRGVWQLYRFRAEICWMQCFSEGGNFDNFLISKLMGVQRLAGDGGIHAVPLAHTITVEQCSIGVANVMMSKFPPSVC